MSGGASPQLENGYTRLANEVIEALMRTSFSAYQSRILWAIWRDTYGYQKKQDWISNSQLVEMTGIKKPHVSRTVHELMTRNVVTKAGNKIAFNKDYTQWRELPKRVTVTNSGNKVTDWGYRSYQSGGTPKKKVIKKNLPSLPKKKTKTFSSDSMEYHLAALLFNCIVKRDHDFKANLHSWAAHTDKLLRVDKRQPVDVANVILWSQKDVFWKNNVLSTAELREKFPRLFLKMNADNGRATKRELVL